MGSRLVFKTRIPDDGWLRVSVALKQEAWTQEGDGVRFLALVSDGRSSDELFIQDVNPFANPTDRKWIPVMVDLSAYAGEEVDVISIRMAARPVSPLTCAATSPCGALLRLLFARKRRALPRSSRESCSVVVDDAADGDRGRRSTWIHRGRAPVGALSRSSLSLATSSTSLTSAQCWTAWRPFRRGP